MLFLSGSRKLGLFAVDAEWLFPGNCLWSLMLWTYTAWRVYQNSTFKRLRAT